MSSSQILNKLTDTLEACEALVNSPFYRNTVVAVSRAEMAGLDPMPCLRDGMVAMANVINEQHAQLVRYASLYGVLS